MRGARVPVTMADRVAFTRSFIANSPIGGRDANGGISAAPRWSVVHVDDLASLYLAAVERAQPGSILHGVGTVIEAAELVRAEAAQSPDLRLVDLETGRSMLGDFADALALEQVVLADHTRAAVGWSPWRLPAHARSV